MTRSGAIAAVAVATSALALVFLVAAGQGQAVTPAPHTPPPHPPRPLPDPVDGFMRSRDLCFATGALVGRVSAVNAYEFRSDDPSLDGEFRSRVVLEVEHEFWGFGLQKLELDVSGGTVGGVTMTTGSAPEYHAGERYFLLIREAAWLEHPKVMLYYEIGPDVVVPPVPQARAEFFRLCGEHPEGIYKGNTIRMENGLLSISKE